MATFFITHYVCHALDFVTGMETWGFAPDYLLCVLVRYLALLTIALLLWHQYRVHDMDHAIVCIDFLAFYCNIVHFHAIGDG